MSLGRDDDLHWQAKREEAKMPVLVGDEEISGL
jgi:hypothetical protein